MDIEDFFPPLTAVVAQAWLDAPIDLANPLLAGVLTDAYGALFTQPEPGAQIARIQQPALATATREGTPVWGGHALTVVPVSAEARALAAESAAGLDTTTGFEVHHALPQAQFRLLLIEEIPGHLDPDSRIQTMRDLMWTLDDALEPLLWLLPSSLSIGPLGERPGSLYDGLIRQRLTASPAGQHTWVVDTLGGEPFAMPDIECHIKGVEPARVEDFVATMVQQMVEGTTSISPGDPVILGEGDEAVFMTAEVETSTLAPMRRLLSLRPQGKHSPDA